MQTIQLQPQIIQLVSVLVGWAATLYFFLFAFSLALGWLGDNSSNAFTVWVRRYTTPYLAWITRVLPAVLKPYAAIWACLFLLFLEHFLPPVVLYLGLVLAQQIGVDTFALKTLLVACAAALELLLSCAFYLSILALLWFAISFTSVSLNHPALLVFFRLLDPLLAPIQNKLPPSRIDYSPLVLVALVYAFSTLVRSTLLLPLIAALSEGYYPWA